MKQVNPSARLRGTLIPDLSASLVVFLVALPLCLGIAIASGAPPVAGILSGVIGGLVVSSLGGSPMQVSGPANSLIVLVMLVVQQHGLGMLGVIVLAAGALQLAAGLARVGQIFRAIPPSIVHGLMTGFAVMIFAGQFHVMLDDLPRTTTVDNLLSMPTAMWEALILRDGSHRAAAIGALTVILLLSWKSLSPRRLAFLPASLVAVVVATVVAEVARLNVGRVQLPESLLDSVHWLDYQLLPRLAELPVLEVAMVMAFLASTETLLSATAVDRLHQGPRTDYDRELVAQGIGNMTCGLVGAVPLTGVVIRSATNVAAGARTRLAGVMHGVWLLLLVVLAPWLLSRIATASLAAVLVVAVFKLIDVRALRELWRQDRREIAIYAVTALGIVLLGVLPGVLLGIGLAIAKLLHTLGRLKIRTVIDESRRRTTLHLRGTATFMSLPRLAAALETVPVGHELHIHFEELSLIDHACLDLLMTWEKRHEPVGSALVLDWEDLAARLKARAGWHGPKVSRDDEQPTVTRPTRHRFFRAGWRTVAGAYDE
ncbi:MAG: SulP family inorganic anion transporter [Planctomycetes bacterium]|nr:SulP family inorganic anion transporter [Planctomycetota bacterium]